MVALGKKARKLRLICSDTLEIPAFPVVKLIAFAGEVSDVQQKIRVVFRRFSHDSAPCFGVALRVAENGKADISFCRQSFYGEFRCTFLLTAAVKGHKVAVAGIWFEVFHFKLVEEFIFLYIFSAVEIKFDRAGKVGKCRKTQAVGKSVTCDWSADELGIFCRDTFEDE